MSAGNKKALSRDKRRASIRKRVRGSGERPRVAVFRSARHIYAQIVDDLTGRTLVSASTLCTELKAVEGNKSEIAEAVGRLLAQRATEANITKVVFDRGGYRIMVVWLRLPMARGLGALTSDETTGVRHGEDGTAAA